MLRKFLKYFASVLFVILCFIPISGQAGENVGNKIVSRDSVQAVALYKKALKIVERDSFDLALEKATEALQLSMKTNQKEIEVSVLSFIAEINIRQNFPGNAIPYLLRAADILESKQDTSSLTDMYSRIAKCYNQEKMILMFLIILSELIIT